MDCLTLTVGAEQDQAMFTLAAIESIKRRYAVKTTLGVSNVSFGLPARKIVNTAFLTMAMYAGLDLPILNPNVPENMQAVDAFNVLSGRDAGVRAVCREICGLQGRAAPLPRKRTAPCPHRAHRPLRKLRSRETPARNSPIA